LPGIPIADHREEHTSLRLTLKEKRGVLPFAFDLPSLPPPRLPLPAASAYFFVESLGPSVSRAQFHFLPPPAGAGHAEVTALVFRYPVGLPGEGGVKWEEKMYGPKDLLQACWSPAYLFATPAGPQTAPASAAASSAVPPPAPSVQTVSVVVLVLLLLIVPLGVWLLGDAFATTALRAVVALVVWLATEEVALLIPHLYRPEWLPMESAAAVAAGGAFVPLFITLGLTRSTGPLGRRPLVDLSGLDRRALQDQRQLLASYQQDLRIVENQISHYAPAEVPVHLVRARDDFKEKVAEVETTIRQLEQGLEPRQTL
jgi:hypothetical protein